MYLNTHSARWLAAPIAGEGNVSALLRLTTKIYKLKMGSTTFVCKLATARTGQWYQLAQVKPPDPQLADEPPEDREPVRTFTEPNRRSALLEPQSGHWGARPSE